MEGDITRLYRILDLEPGVSLEEVKRSYRVLVKVWHPDRFVNDPEMQANAQEKLKKINFAYELIRKDLNARTSNKHSASGSSGPKTEAAPSGQYKREKSATQSSGSHGGTNEASPKTPATRKKPSGRANFLKFAFAIMGFMLFKALFSSRGSSSNHPKDYLHATSPPISNYRIPETKVRELPMVSQWSPVSRKPAFAEEKRTIVDVPSSTIRVEAEKNIQPPVPVVPLKAIPVEEEVPLRAIPVEGDVTPILARNNDIVRSEPIKQEHGYFTVGSTRDQVVAVQGAPTHVSENEFNYKYSSVNFRDGKVVGWNDISKVLKARMSADANVRSLGSFTVGSTKDEVLAAQGTPTQVSENEFNYQYSSVNFLDGRVVAWNDISKVLKSKMPTEANARSRGYFTVGSTKDEVVAAQGSPTQVSENEFSYQYSSVSFRDGKVVAWNDISKVLKTKMLPEASVQSKGYFTVGSTRDEVLAAQGTPTQVSESEFNYRYSSVNFRNGRVVAWNDISKLLKTKMLPSASVQSKGYFTIGSTKDEVLAVQGTPTQVSESEFNYGYSSVTFRSGKVVAWNDISKILKTR